MAEAGGESVGTRRNVEEAESVLLLMAEVVGEGRRNFAEFAMWLLARLESWEEGEVDRR